MTTTTTQTLVATARDGSEVTLRTRAGYTQAAIAKGSGGWYLVAKGFSADSVRARARTKLGSHAFEVRPFVAKVQGVAERDIPEDIAKYFERKRQMTGNPRERRQVPMIVEVHWRGGGPFEAIDPVPATWTAIRELATQGAYTVACQGYGSLPADFPVEPLLRQASLPLLGGSVIGSRRSAAR
jgi:hypothetical protein